MRISLLLVMWLAAVASGGVTSSADSETERVERFLEDRVRRDPDDHLAQNRLADIYLQRLRENGDYEWLRRAVEAVRRSLASVPAEQNATGLFLRAQVEYESHHFAAARDLALSLTKIEPGKSRGFVLLGDALLEFGDLDEAAAAYAQIQKRPADPIETESRLARLELVSGEFAAARAHFDKALQSARAASSPSPEVVAWCLIQLGQLAFNTGQWDAAEQYFQSALREQPDNFVTQEHLAELRAAQEKYDESIRLYEQVIKRTARPEFCQALGDVYAAMGKIAEAARWRTQARDSYLKNANEGNAHYFHHLAGFFADVEEKPEEALKWARRDLELRHTAAAEDTLAWVLYRGGQYAEAAEIMKRIVARGPPDAHILDHAGMILLAAGDPDRGKKILAEAARINPKHNSFHVHR
ncbi:MAG: tetratricopeptide repeat protein [Chthoniobacterales bacterium]